MFSGNKRDLNELQQILIELSRPTPLNDLPRRTNLCQQALERISKQTHPRLWAALQNDLANILVLAPTVERAENIEQAIGHFQQALEVYTRQDFPQDWAQTMNNLASAYWNRIRGERAENLEQAIYHLQQALEVRTRQAFPQDWAETMNNLAATYRDRILGDRVENLEQAIYHLQQALEVYTRQLHPERWAGIQNNLGLAYSDRIRGERAENLEQAIYHLQQALEVRTHQDFPEDWAQTMNNLANAYSDRIRGERAENLEQAIYHLQQALEVRTRQAFPQDWAITQNNLANAYARRIRGARAENVEQAIHHHQQVLEVNTRRAFPQQWAMTQHNLANTYYERIRGERAENLEQAIYHYQQALEVRTRQAFPQDWAQTMNSQGVAYKDRIRGERAGNREQAIYHFQQALEVYTRQAYPKDCRMTARNLGDLAFDQEDWQLSSVAYLQALAAQDALMQTSFTRLGKQAELREMQEVASQSAYVLIQLGEIQRGVEVLEQGRAQLLRESLERQRRDLEQLPTLGFESLYVEYIEATRRYDELQIIGQIETTRPADWLAQTDDALKKVQGTGAAIRDEVGQTHPQYRYFLQALPFAEIQKQATNRPLIYLTTTPKGGLALVMSKQGATVLALPDLTSEGLRARIYGPADELALGGYLRAYIDWRRDPTKQEARAAWFKMQDGITHWLWDVVMREVVAVLKTESQALTLIPTGLLALLPLHAAWTNDESKPGGRRFALDEMNITYAPSAHALWQASLSFDRPAEYFMAVDNPDGSLIFSENEVQAALQLFTRAIHLHGKNASMKAVREEMQRTHVLHFSTHGVAGWQDGELARLKLCDGDLTLPEIFALHLGQARLAVLSACETGMPGLELIDEMIGLPSGMMQAGVPSVIGSLWAVNDMSTAMLMARFYSLWREEGLTPQEALRQAQIWLRDSTTTEKKKLFKHFVEQQTLRMTAETAQAFYQYIGWDDPDARVFASPYYWAAFTYTGV